MDAVHQFETAAELDPLLAAAPFQLYNIYRQSGRRRMRRSNSRFPDVEEAKRGRGDSGGRRVVQLRGDLRSPRATSCDSHRREPRITTTALWTDATGMMLIDSTGSGQIDIVWSSTAVHLYRNGSRAGEQYRAGTDPRRDLHRRRRFR